MDGPEALKEIAKQVGGKITEMGRLPDSAGFARMSKVAGRGYWEDTENASGKGMRLPAPGSFLFLAVRFRP